MLFRFFFLQLFLKNHKKESYKYPSRAEGPPVRGIIEMR